MLNEMWLWLRAQCDKPARQLGHLSEAIALDARAKRQQALWQTHLHNSRQAILRVAAQCSRTRCAVILGSGSCHDVPVAELAAQFDQVLLVDIVHLPLVHARIKPFPNVQLLQQDLTGMVAMLAACHGRVDAETLASWSLPLPAVLQRADIDFVASVNLLSQLPVKPIEYLQRHATTLSLQDMNGFAWRLLRAHVDALRQLRVPVCLVSDDIQRTWNHRQELIEHIALLDTLGLAGKVFERWQWPVAPPGELPDGHHAEHDVAAVQL